MKKLFLLLALILSNATLFSCTDDSLVENDGLYQLQANGEDGDPDDEPEDPDDPNKQSGLN